VSKTGADTPNPSGDERAPGPTSDERTPSPTSDESAPGPSSDESAPGPTSDEIVVILFQAAMSSDAAAYARKHAFDPKLLDMWKFTHAQEYIVYLEKLLRVIKTRARDEWIRP
jgi:hypothetical protein